jgi:hypothetical protein
MDAVLRRYPGYTIATLLEADAHELAILRALIWSHDA